MIDEAHNLADRARDMYSAQISSLQFEKIYSVIDESERELDETFEKIILYIRSMRKLCKDTLSRDREGKESGFYISNTMISSFVIELDVFRKKCDQWLKKNGDHILSAAVSNLATEVKKYLYIADFFDNRFYNYLYIYGDTTYIRIFCLDPSYILNKIMCRSSSTIMFSATLTPMDYFSHILGNDSDSQRLSLPSPFDPSNLCVSIAGYVSTRFEDRRESISKYVSVIAATVSRKAGNYIAYFPSYGYLEKVHSVYNAFVKKYNKVDTIIQKKGMSLTEKNEFLDFFKDDSDVLRIGFCVLGGSFSEGVDLPGGKLIGAIIFGLGLPGLSNERNIMRDYYNNLGENGYDYAYTFPGMNNILQAAGRVIRKDDDMGVVVLADDRYCDEKYRMLFPRHWKNIKKADNASELAQIIQNFWHKRSKNI